MYRPTSTSSRPRGRGRPRSTEAGAYREEILRIAGDVFIEKGYAAASTSEIARRAGASKTTLYSMFPSKADLFIGIIGQRSEAAFADLARLAEDTSEPEEVLYSFGMRILTLSTSPEVAQLRRIAIPEVLRFPELAQRFWKVGPGRALQILRTYFEGEIARRHLEIRDPEKATEVFLALAVGGKPLLADLNLLGERPPDWKERHVREAVANFLKIYGAAPSPDQPR